MSKQADRYLDVHPWQVTEKGFSKSRSRVSESIFSLGNEFMGVRGFFDEGYSGDSLIGSYFNGIFEYFDESHPAPHNGLATRNQKMASAVNWLFVRLKLGKETLDIDASKVTQFSRTLDLKTGILTRSFVWTTTDDRKLRVTFERFTSMAKSNIGGQRIVLEPMNFSGSVRVTLGLDFSPLHHNEGRNLWDVHKKGAQGDVLGILGRLPVSGHMVLSTCRVACSAAFKPRRVDDEKFVGLEGSIRLTEGNAVTIDKLVANFTERSPRQTPAKMYSRDMKTAKKLLEQSYDDARTDHADFWAGVWANLDIEIEGDELNQQGVRFCIFQLHQVYHGVDPNLNVSAKGLTGEGYDGKAWWDTETYCLPFYMFNNPRAARNLLGYRYTTLDAAVRRSAEVDDCLGARYPMCTIDGDETCAVWQHGDLEIHVSAAVAYGIWHYDKVIGDKSLLYGEGIEILIEVCRYYATRGQYSQLNGDFGYWNVMGPDEFHMQCHNNAYTNVMAKRMFEYTLEVIEEMKKAAPKELAAAKKKRNLKPAEMKDWAEKARKMRTQYDRKTEMIEQHDGFYDLPHIDVSKISPEELPLYYHWAYLRIFRYDMIKQPDVLLLPFFFSNDYSMKCKKVNYEYYEPRCSHESSLSPAVHSIMAAELGKHKEAYDYFGHATRLDLDNSNRNTDSGLHTTSMARPWMNIGQGLCGMRTDGDVIDFNPSIPKKWKSFTFRLLYRGSVLEVKVTKKDVTFTVTEGEPISIRVFGKKTKVSGDGTTVKLPAGRKG